MKGHHLKLCFLTKNQFTMIRKLFVSLVLTQFIETPFDFGYKESVKGEKVSTSTQGEQPPAEIDNIIDRGSGKIKTLQELKLSFPDNRSKSIHGDFGCSEKTLISLRIN